MPKITFLGAGSTIFAKNVLGDSMLEVYKRQGYDRSEYEGDRGQPGFLLALPFFRDLSKAARRVSHGLPQRNALTAAQFSASHRRVAKIRHVKRLSVADHGFMREQSGHRVSCLLYTSSNSSSAS